MHTAPEIAAGIVTRRAGARRAWALVLLLGVAVVLAAGFVIYNQVRTSMEQRQAAMAVIGGDPSRAPAILGTYGCIGCHTIPGISGATGQVGPDLANIARRVYVAGVVTNTPRNLIDFIIDPKSIDPKTAMPTTGISPREAADVAAYLYSIH